MTGNIQPNNTVHLTSQLIDTGTGDNRGNGNQSSSQIDSFLAGIRSNLTAINLPPPPSSTPSRNNTPKIQPTQFLQINHQHYVTASANLSKLSESKGFAIFFSPVTLGNETGYIRYTPQIVKQHAWVKEEDQPPGQQYYINNPSTFGPSPNIAIEMYAPVSGIQNLKLDKQRKSG